MREFEVLKKVNHESIVKLLAIEEEVRFNLYPVFFLPTYVFYQVTKACQTGLEESYSTLLKAETHFFDCGINACKYKPNYAV